MRSSEQKCFSSKNASIKAKILLIIETRADYYRRSRLSRCLRTRWIYVIQYTTCKCWSGPVVTKNFRVLAEFSLYQDDYRFHSISIICSILYWQLIKSSLNVHDILYEIQVLKWSRRYQKFEDRGQILKRVKRQENHEQLMKYVDNPCNT